MTEVAGQKLAARSKEVAADLRKPRESGAESASDQPADSWPADMPSGQDGQPD